MAKLKVRVQKLKNYVQHVVITESTSTRIKTLKASKLKFHGDLEALERKLQEGVLEDLLQV